MKKGYYSFKAPQKFSLGGDNGIQQQLLFAQDLEIELDDNEAYFDQSEKEKERTYLTAILDKKKFDGGMRQMIWGALTLDGSRTTVKVENILNSTEQCKILENNIISKIQVEEYIYISLCMIMQDVIPQIRLNHSIILRRESFGPFKLASLQSAKSIRVQDNIEWIHELIEDDPNLSLQTLYDQTNLSQTSIQNILREDLQNQFMCQMGFPYQLTPQQKQQRANRAESILKKINKNVLRMRNGFFYRHYLRNIISKADLIRMKKDQNK
ncbi:hypothetical protein ABPG74_005771 [Tetrahymena malaccensis]